MCNVKDLQIVFFPQMIYISQTANKTCSIENRIDYVNETI